MSSDSIGNSIRATTTGSHSPVATGGVEQESKETTCTPLFAFETPTRDFSKRDSSDTLESSRRKKYRGNISSSVAYQHVSRSTGTGLAVSNLDFPASILARIDECNVPMNEFILATPNQVRCLAIQYPTTVIVRPRAISISTSGCYYTDPSTDSLDEIFSKDRHRGSPRPTLSGYDCTTTTKTSRVFLPITEQHLEEGVSQVEDAGFATTDTRGFGFRLKPRFMTLAVRYGTRPWDPI
jgi:hypothetical protein